MNKALKKLNVITLFLLLFKFTVNAQTKGFDSKNIDNTCKPCDDFYQYANGGWMKNNPIPDDQASWGNFNVLQQKNQQKLKQIVEELSTVKHPQGTPKQRLSDFYSTAMNTVNINKLGYSPIKPILQKINKINTKEQLELLIAELHTQMINVGFVFSSGQDLKDSKRVIGECFQAGITLPDRDYYLNNDDKTNQIRSEYRNYILKMLKLINVSEQQAKEAAQEIINIETALATASLSRVEMRDPYAVYNLVSVNELNKLTPHFSWNNYFNKINCPPITQINMATPKFIKAFDSLLANISIKNWKYYLTWHVLNNAAPYLSQSFETEHFNFHKKILTGVNKQQDRWKTVIQAIDMYLGDDLGQVYVEKYFTPESKKRVIEMITNIKEALKQDILSLQWMGDSTKQRALEKLSTFEDKIGYPEVWKDYSSIKITTASYYDNVLACVKYEYFRQLNKIGKPIDKKEWQMTVPTINAYYNPLMNEIVFPAGILQPPFFDIEADDAINYGGMGAVIGHEITHGFDDQGAQFDAQGNLRNWWLPDDENNFKNRANCIIKQYSSFKVQDSLNLNGALVVGESIADLGGLTLAWHAYLNSLKGKPEPPSIDGFTHKQRFFLGWAQVWAMNNRSELERLKLKTDPHPPSKYRVNGPLVNLEFFSEAFNCTSGDKMFKNSSEKCVIW